MSHAFRNLRSSRRALAVAAVAVLIAAVGALAYWAASGSGTASGSVGTLNAPTEASGASTSGSSTVAVSWTASTPANGLSPTGYYVKRWDGATPSVAGGTCGSPASPVNQTSCNDTSVPDGTYTYTVVAVYHSWTAESSHSTSVTVVSDATPPTDSLSLSGASHAVLSGETLYFKGDLAGQFNLIDTVTDSGSGPASATFPTLSATNWTTHSTETVSTPSGGPYASSAFKWSAGAASPSTYTVTSKDVAGNTSGGSTLTFVSDATAPTAGAVTVNGTAASAGGSSSYATSTSFTISARTNYTDGGSGLASSILTIQSETLSNNVCGAPGSGGAYTSPTTISGTTNPATATGFCYLYTLTGTDNVGNAASVKTTVKVDSTAPTTPTLSFTGLSSNAFYSSGQNTLYFRPAAGGAYTVTAASTDGESGIASGNAGYTFSSLSANNFSDTQTFDQSAYTFGASATQPGSDPTVFATSNAGSSSANASYELVSDTAAPTAGAVTVNGTAATGAGSTSASTSTSFTISARTNYTDSGSGLASSVLTIQSATLSNNVCGEPGSGGAYTSPTTISGTTNPATASGFCYLYTLTGTDNVGNAASVKTTVKVDSVLPTNALSLGSSSNAFLSGSTLYFNSGVSGNFTLINTVSDTTSGPASASFPLVSATNWTHAAQTVSTPAGGPYTSSTYSWTSGAGTPSGSQATFTSKDNAGNTSANAALTFTPDTTVPATGAVTVNGTAASSGGTTSTNTSTSFAISARTDYTDSGSGLASSILTIQSETLSNNACGAPGSGGAYMSPTPISGTTNPATATGFCYLYTLTGTDNVGNTASVKTTVKVDSVLPTNALSLGSSTNAFLSGSTLYFNSGVAGSFTLINTVSDASSGPASATFPLVTATNWTHAAQTVSTPAGGPYTSSTYSWTSGAATPSGSQATFASKDNAGNASANTLLTFTPDTTVPTSGAMTVNGTPATGVGSTSTSTSTSPMIYSRTDYADGGSGLASSVLTIQSETLSNNTCGAPGSGGAYTSPTPISGTTNPATATGFCYLYTLTGTDNVGNTASVKTTMKVDSVLPTNALSLGTSSNAFLSGSTLYFNSAVSGNFTLINTVSDASSGPASATFPLVSASKWTHAAETVNAPAGGPYTSTTYSWTSASGTPSGAEATFTSKDNATNTSANTVLTFTPDTTAPSGGSVSVPARVKALSVSVTFSGGTDSGSGVSTASGELQRAEATYTGSSDMCGSFGAFAKVGSAGPSSPFSDTTIASGKCYQYQYKVADNVGNATTYGPSGTLKVNTSGPALASMSTAGGNGILETGDVLTLTFSQTILASSVPTSGTIVQAKTGSGANATVTITGLGTEWSLGSSSAYQTSKTSAEFNETASVSGPTVTVTVGSKVGGTTPIAGSANTVTGTLSSSVKDVFENNASASTFSLTSTKLW